MDCYRTPNTKCSICGSAVYRRPNELARLANVYCSRKCLFDGKSIKTKTCGYCGKNFKPQTRTANFCSHSCSNKGRAGIKYLKETKGTKSKQRLELLKDTFDFTSCMVEGCQYDRCFDIHRLIEGKNGGKYEIGNMFAICPNHHAEVHRNVIKLEKISDCQLRVIDDEEKWNGLRVATLPCLEDRQPNFVLFVDSTSTHSA